MRKATSDKKNSMTEPFGITVPNVWKTGLLADVHYSKFNSSFGSGKYSSFSLSKNFTDSFRLQFLGGHQTFNSALTTNNNSNFVKAVVDWNVTPPDFLEGNFAWNRGTSPEYHQWSPVFGYRLGEYEKKCAISGS